MKNAYYFGLYKLERENLIALIKEHGVILVESILKSLHFIAYEQRKHEFDSESEIIPVEYKKTNIEYKPMLLNKETP